MVEEFDMSDTTVEAECFGGTYKAKVYDNGEYELESGSSSMTQWWRSLI